MGELLNSIESPIDIEKLMSKLEFSADDFEGAAMEQPKLYLQAGRYRSQCLLNRARADLGLDVAQAELGLELRGSKDREKKPTEKAIENQVVSDRRIIALRKKLYVAETAEEWSRQIVEAYRQRLMVLKIIGDIRASEISSELRAVKEKAAVDVVRRAADKVRKSYEDNE